MTLCALCDQPGQLDNFGKLLCGVGQNLWVWLWNQSFLRSEQLENQAGAIGVIFFYHEHGPETKCWCATNYQPQKTASMVLYDSRYLHVTWVTGLISLPCEARLGRFGFGRCCSTNDSSSRTAQGSALLGCQMCRIMISLH